MAIVTIVTPASNLDDLKAAIQCVKMQTFTEYKHLIIFDGPSDETQEYITKLNDEHIEFKYTLNQTKNWGHSQRAMGLELCDTEFICFYNDDDIMEPNYLVEMLNALDMNKVDLVVCKVRVFKFGNQFIASGMPVKYGNIDAGSFMVRTKYAKQVGWNSRRYYADYLFVQECLIFNKQVRYAYVDKILLTHH